ncbi:unnamed protein product [Moneuplotes crassus]|uniref:Uncharacterized protein n=1 Tax=Euplotes crassus TaxID=5936 RepID=A0AAD1XCE3_EUPCR|nr:unnamed protein product [Moneuplotes crassus]
MPKEEGCKPCSWFPIITFYGVFGAILYFGYQNVDEEATTDAEASTFRTQNIRRAFLAILAVYFGHRVFNDNIYSMFKPFNRIWSIFGNTCYLYLYLLVFVYMMNHYDARKMWGFVESRLGKPVTKEYHTYDDDCTISWYNIIDNMDHYFLAHFTNWFLAAVILRDSYLLHFWSLLDEILELSAQHRLPHFRECWWDHVFHDFLLTNTPGIILGLKFVKLLGLKEYDWLGRKGKSSIREWRVFNCYYRFGGIIQMYFIISANFLTGFFMINVLWLPPLSIPTVTRMYIWFLLGNISFKEGYNVLESKDDPKRRNEYNDPSNRWVTYGIVILEIAISLKFVRDAGNLTEDPMPMYVIIFWSIVLPLLAGYYIYLRWIRNTDKEFEEQHLATPSKKSVKKNGFRRSTDKKRR